jgi:hypothetical protein
LGAGEHTIRLVKRTESIAGQARFKGFVLAPGGLLLPPPPRPEYVETAVTHFNTAQHDPNVHFLRIPNTLSLQTDYGCDYHPNIIGQQKIADYLLPKIQEVMESWSQSQEFAWAVGHHDK